MSDTIERTDTMRRRIGQCPACRDYLWAEVVLVSTLRPPIWAEGHSPSPSSDARAVAMTLDHACDKRCEGDPA